MSLNLVTSIVAFSIFSICTFAQIEIDKNADSLKTSIFYNHSRQKLIDVSLSYQKPIATGNNFVGQGLEGENGYNFNIRLFVYKQAFIGFTYGRSQFDVIEPSILGNYTSTTIEERFLFAGYEFLPFDKIRLGLYSSFTGRLTFSNNVVNNSGNKDTGNLWSFGINLSYDFTKTISAFGDFAFRSSRTDIDAPEAFQSTFESGTYNAINFGLRFSFGKDYIFQ